MDQYYSKFIQCHTNFFKFLFIFPYYYNVFESVLVLYLSTLRVRLQAELPLFLVLGVWDKNTGILCAGAMEYRRDFPTTTRI